MKHALVISLLLGTLLILASCNGTESSSQANPNERAASSPPVGGAPKGLTEAQFEHALRNISTAPNYVVITLIDSNTDRQETVCIEAEALLSAVRIEQELKWKEAVEFVLKQKDRVFRFSNARALKWVSRAYTEAILAEACEFLANMTVDEIDTATCDQDSKFYEFCAREPGSFLARFPAIAHVLTERGILCVRGCLPGLFHIDRSTHNKPDAGDGK